jgi:hypothetical protein
MTTSHFDLEAFVVTFEVPKKQSAVLKTVFFPQDGYE